MNSLGGSGLSLGELLHEWLPRQRWFAGRGGECAVELLAGVPVVDEGPACQLDLQLVRVRTPGFEATYQVPVSYRAEPLPEIEAALIGTLNHPEFGLRWVYDACHDPAFAPAWLGVLNRGRVVGGPTASLRGELQPGAVAPGPRYPSRVLSAEQSNTSIITLPPPALAGGPGNDAVIIKVFRVVQEGQNPDVSVLAVLTEAGCPQVPPPVGWLEGTWPGVDGNLVTGHLAAVSRFYADSADAWSLACEAAREGRDFEAEAQAIGRATATVHQYLAEVLPTQAGSPLDRRQLIDRLLGRLARAVDQLPALAEFEPAARALIEGLSQVNLPGRWQRVHGDFHLGQVLRVGGERWLVLDFEGEPIRPISERTGLDLVARDLAGMLRSFDYAAGHLRLGHDGEESGDGWARASQDAFLAGYRAGGGADPAENGDLLQVFELDKAVYEAVYESRHRPDWLPIPMGAIARLVGAFERERC